MISVRSLPRICVALGASDAAALHKMALTACDTGEEFVELRLDMLAEPRDGLGIIRRLHRRRPDLKILATCRRTAAQGEFRGSIEEQEKILAAAAAAGAHLLDVEIETAEPSPGTVERLRSAARVIVSFHDFERTPPPDRVLRRLRRIPADIYKIAVTGLKPSDNTRLLGLLDDRAEPLVVLAMGEVGAPSRVLGPARGAAFAFASPDTAAGTAPGQITASRMRRQYRAHKIKPDAQVFGVIASPVAHSMSPPLHNRAFQSRRWNAVYLPFLVAPERLTDFFEVARALPVQGFSVTIPHKQRVIRRLEGVDALAKRIGAVNTVYRKRGKLFGTNTDVAGVTAPLEKRMRLRGSQVLVVGAGGAARAAAFALADKGAKVALTGRSFDKVRRLARAAGAEAVAWDKLPGRGFDALVQTTPVGMHPHVEGNLFPQEIPAEVVFDMVYNPLETALIRQARESGKETIPGLEMFLEQAAAQFEIWTRQSAPRQVMKAAVLDLLQGV